MIIKDTKFNHFTKIPLALLLCAGVLFLAVAQTHAGSDGITKVKVTADAVIVEGVINAVGLPATAKLSLYAYEYHEDERVLANSNLVAGPKLVKNNGLDSLFSFSIPRFAPNGLDRLFCVYVLALDAGEGPSVYGYSHYPDDIKGISRWDYPIEARDTFKGLSCVKDTEDALALKIGHFDLNTFLGQHWFQDGPGEETIIHEVDGKEYYFNKHRAERHAGRLKGLTDHGVTGTFIFCIGNRTYSWKDDELKKNICHPDSVEKGPETSYYVAPNVRTRDGVNLFRAVFEFFGEYYMRADSKNGRLEGITVANEINSGWTWTNMGRKTLREYMKDYIKALRIAYYSVRKYYSRARIYISLDHCWTIRLKDDPRGYYKGKDVIDVLAEHCRKHGDFDWGLNYHPYPENLFESNVWDDETASFSYNTERITGKNLEVLSSYMEREDLGGYLYEGNKLRRIMFGEHGCHCWDINDEPSLGEQAACFVYNYWKMKYIDVFDSWCYHRHEDEPEHDAGLQNGIWTPNMRREKEPIYSVFRDIDDDPEGVSAFAKEFARVKDWKEIMLNDTTVTRPETILMQDGNGRVLVTATVDDIYRDTVKVRVEYSLDGGRSFLDGDAYINNDYGVRADYGSPGIDNDSYFQVRNVDTSEGPNMITFAWETKSALNGTGAIDYAKASKLVIKVKARNDNFTGIPERSAVFNLKGTSR